MYGCHVAGIDKIQNKCICTKHIIRTVISSHCFVGKVPKHIFYRTSTSFHSLFDKRAFLKLSWNFPGALASSPKKCDIYSALIVILFRTTKSLLVYNALMLELSD